MFLGSAVSGDLPDGLKGERKMKRKIRSLLLAAVLVAAAVLPGLASTMNAIPPWPEGAIYGVVSLERPDAFLQRTVNSLLVRTAMSHLPEAQFATQWLSKFPVNSLSLAVGYGEKGFSLQGAARFNEGKKALLAKLAEGKGEEGDLDALLDSPMPGMLLLAPMDGGTYGVIQNGTAMVLISVESDMLLMGFSPEDIAAAREALKDPQKRMKIDRKLAQDNFFYFHDNGMAAENIRNASKGALPEPQALLAAELAFGLTQKGFDLSLLSNFSKVFPAPEGSPAAAPLSGDQKLLLGGGKPWFSAVLQLALDKRHFQGVRDAAQAGDENAAQVVKLLEDIKQFGLDEDAILSILKTMGVVLGSQTSAFGSPLPGGYVYVSGKKESVELLLPILEMAAREAGIPFESKSAPGWTALYSLKDPVEAFMGIRGGSVLAGLVSEGALGSAPELGPGMKSLFGDSGVYSFLYLDGGVLRSTAMGLLNPDGPWAPFVAKDEMAGSIPAIIEGMKASAEIEAIDIRVSSAERLDFAVRTAEAKKAELDAMNALAAKWRQKLQKAPQVQQKGQTVQPSPQPKPRPKPAKP